jgi:hypothetical protein
MTQRPEALTDKQILKRLNHQVKESYVFQKFNYYALPSRIQKLDGHSGKADKKAKKTRRRREEKKVLQMATANEEIIDSDTS